MRTTSASARASASRARSAAVGVCTTVDARGRRDGQVRREQRHVRPAPRRLRGERDAHLPGGAVAEEPDRVERLAGPAGGDEHALARRAAVAPGAPSSSRQRAAIASGSAIRPAPTSPSASSPESGPISSQPRSTTQRRVRLRRRVLPHPHVHRGREQHRPAERERGLGQHRVREPVRELGERRGRERRDDEQVGLREVRIEVARASPGARAPRRSRARRTARRRA